VSGLQSRYRHEVAAVERHPGKTKKRHIGRKKEKSYHGKVREDAIFEATEEDKETKAKKSRPNF